MSSPVKAPIFKNNRTTLERLEKFVSDEYFTDCNLRGQLYADKAPLKKLSHVDCGQTRLPFAEAITKLEKEGKEIQPGISIGPSWSTHWFKAEIVVPPTWIGRNVHFRWDSESEALVWSKSGQSLKGLSSEYGKTDFQISSITSSTSQTELYVEVACNTLFGCGKGGMINPPDADRRFTLKSAEIVIFREDVFRLLMDFDILIGMAKHLPEKSSKRYDAMYFANNLVNNCDPNSPPSIADCHHRAEEFLSRSSSTPNSDSGIDFVVHAVGNSHIDTAWLWPYDETKRKCARTFSTVLRLLDEYPDQLRFAVSQAQQLDWIRLDYPDLFDRLRKAASGDDRKLFGVGGCWVEMDGNIPSGESLVRQILYGQKFFQQYFGRRCTEFWLPDTFGYPSQLPQLMSQAGMRRFVTQKLSWNLVNRFPHQTFWWQGLDGTKVLTHFPPADTYCSRVTVEEAVKIEQDFADKGRSRTALMLYGYGDGGGGPDEAMLERLKRMKALPGVPKVRPSTPGEFFAAVESNDLQNLSTWTGELYLELHNGTYTTHGDMKYLNRKMEFVLRDCEFVSAILWANDSEKKKSYKNWEIEWKNILLNQFHDVLPGTSIKQVYVDAERLYIETLSTCGLYLSDCEGKKESDPNGECLLNTFPWTRLVEISASADVVYEKSDAFFDSSADASLKIFEEGDTIILGNNLISAVIDKQTGQLSSLLTIKSDLSKEANSTYDAIRPGRRGNRFVLYDDVPLYWDAWDVMDYHLETGKVCEIAVEEAKIVESTPIRCAVEFVLNIGNGSRLKQKIILRPDQPYLEFNTEIDWKEKHKFLKVELPVNVHANEATYEIQFGHIKRPTHWNTSWDSAKFEVCGHKWADVSETDFGVALLNNCKYGHSCHDGILSLSLVRGSTAPDEDADLRLDHRFAYAIMPHFGPLHRPETGRLNVIQAAYELNSAVQSIQLSPTTAASISGRAWMTIDNSAVMIESVKVAEDGKSLIVRLYECNGGKAWAKLGTYFRLESAIRCDLLEEPLEGEKPLEIGSDGKGVAVSLKAFEVQTVRLVLA